MAKQKQPGSLREAQAMLGDQARLKALLGSAEVRQLASLLDSSSGHTLGTAVQKAKDGNTAQLEQLVRNLSASQEGARLMERLQGKLEH